MRRFTLLSILSVTACSSPSTEVVFAGGVPLGAAPSTVAVYGPTAADPTTLLVRSVDVDLLSSGPATVLVTVDGSQVEVMVDGRGYGTMTFEHPTAVELGGVGQAVAVIGEEPWASTWPLAHPGLPRASAVESAARGVLVAAEEEVWWAGEALPPHPVARFPGGVAGLRAAAVDGDGLPDALTWGGEKLVLLRGREGGGASLGFGLIAQGWSVAGAAVEDIDGDGDSDLAVVWETPSGAVVQVWAGDGAWGFEPYYERRIPGGPRDLTIARDRGDGLPVISVLTDDDSWVRVLRDQSGGWLLTGPTVNLLSAEGSVLRSVGDYNESGADNLALAMPRVQGQTREVQVWSLDDDNPTFLRTSAQGAHLGFAEVEPDGRLSILTLDEEKHEVRQLRFNDGLYRHAEAGETWGFGAIGAGSLQPGETMSALIGEEAWSWYPGEIAESSGGWSVAPVPQFRHDLGLVGPLVSTDVGEIVGFTIANGALRLGQVRFESAGPELRERIPVGGEDDEIVHVATCGPRIWVLLQSELVAVRLGEGVTGSRAVSDPIAVACHGDVAAILHEDGLTRVTPSGGLLGLGEHSAGQGLVLLDEETPVICEESCLGWPTDTGLMIVSAGDEAISVHEPSGTLIATLPGGGAELGVQDVDGDGLPDLIWRWGSGYVGATRASGGQVGSIGALRVPPDARGAPVLIGGEVWLKAGESLVGPG